MDLSYPEKKYIYIYISIHAHKLNMQAYIAYACLELTKRERKGFFFYSFLFWQSVRLHREKELQLPPPRVESGVK